MGRQRLGILGGTFDPIHNGHLMIARAMLDKLGLDRILFIPDYIPPHKRGWHCSPSADRLAMTILAAAEDPRYTVSPMELDRAGYPTPAIPSDSSTGNGTGSTTCTLSSVPIRRNSCLPGTISGKP